ncbi:MAG: T9SS type A sorting domain-containing protein [Prevotellaceae bacterium]|jgi:hypothetical protein|nr:T9SS type A sorting domain-containing protein [Prevotellaceae bacterium]
MKHYFFTSLSLLLFGFFYSNVSAQSLMIANFEGDGTDLICNKRFITLEGGNPFETVDNPYNTGNNPSLKVMKVSPVYKAGGFRLNLSANISTNDTRITDGKTYNALRLKYRVNNTEEFPALNAGIRINGQESCSAKARWQDKTEDWKTALFIFTTFPSGTMTYIEIEPYQETWTESGVAIQDLEIYIDNVELVRFEPVEKLMVLNFENNGSDKMCSERYGPVGSGSTLTIVDNPYKEGNNTSEKVLKISDVVQYGGFHLNLTRNITNESDKIVNGTEYTGFRMKYRVNDPASFSTQSAGINLNGMSNFTATGAFSDTDKDWQTVTFTFETLPANIANIQIQPYKKTWTNAGSPISGLEIYVDDMELFKMDDFSEGLLNTITVNGKELEFFEPETKEYTCYLPYTTTEIPLVEFTPSKSGQIVSVTPAASLTGTEAERTSILIITENAEEVSRYNITFEVIPELDIYICLGQSNMSGYGEIANEDRGVIEDTYLLTPNTNFEPAEVPLNKYSTISNGTYAKINPAYGFAKALIGKSTNPVGLLVNARNGSAIDWWKKGNTQYKLYEQTLERAKEARKWGSVKGILWHQGESDSWQASAYPDLLEAWVNDFRADLGDTNNEIYFVAGELAYWRQNGTGSTAFNEMIRTISTFIPNSDWVSADELTPWANTDDPHFDRESNIILGERYAEKVINKFYDFTTSENITDKDGVSDIHCILNGNRLVVNNTTNTTLRISIYDILGKSIFVEDTSESAYFILHRAGIYIICLSGEKDRKVEKLIIK